MWRFTWPHQAVLGTAHTIKTSCRGIEGHGDDNDPRRARAGRLLRENSSLLSRLKRSQTQSSTTCSRSNSARVGLLATRATRPNCQTDGKHSSFADTYIGTTQADHIPTFTGLVHSSELVGTLPNLASDYGGTYSAPQALLPDTFDPAGIWESLATLVFDDSQMIFVNEYKGPSGILTLRYTGRSGIAEMTVPPGGLPQLQSVTLLPEDPVTTWGSATLKSGGYQYIYGAVIDGPQHSTTGMKVARVPFDKFLDIGSWTYWNGSQWVNGESNAVTVTTKNDLTGVVPNPNGRGFIAVSIPWGVLDDTTVDLSYATNPQGPWTTPESVYTIPEIREYAGEEAYFPTFHPELSANPDQLVVSYDIDTDEGYSVINRDIRSYQPRFLTITG